MNPKVSTMRVPVPIQTWKGWQRGAGWQAETELSLSNPHRVTATGKTEAEAKASLQALLLSALRRAEERSVMVIGGTAPDYHESIHVITPTAYGYNVNIIRAGKHAGSWTTANATMEETLAEVLTHVGGTPSVVRLS